MAARQSTLGGQQYNADVRKRPCRRGKRTKAGICTVSLMERAPGYGPGFVGVQVFYGVPKTQSAIYMRYTPRRHSLVRVQLSYCRVRQTSGKSAAISTKSVLYKYLGVAKLGIALRLGRRDRGFKSLHSDCIGHQLIWLERCADNAKVPCSTQGCPISLGHWRNWLSLPAHNRLNLGSSPRWPICAIVAIGRRGRLKPDCFRVRVSDRALLTHRGDSCYV